MNQPYSPSLLAAILSQNSQRAVIPTLLGETVKRKVFFSFHYDDVFRVNAVRNAWKIDHPDSPINRSFYDSSLWETKKIEGDESVKRLIREGVSNTSAVCVLVGSSTWCRRWVRYEIARAVIDGRGLLAVHINGLSHHQRKTADLFGPNPLDYMAVGLCSDGKQYLFERKWVPSNLLAGDGTWQWQRYSDYVGSVPLPPWLSSANEGYVRPLSEGATSYNYISEGHKNIGVWIDVAARKAGR